MRQGFWSGCFELAHVVVVARTPSSTTPRIYAQDASGGDFSAIVGKCDATSTHPCPSATATAASRVLDGAVLTLRGYYHHGMQSDFEEFHLDQVADERRLATPPRPRSLRVSDIARGANNRIAFYQAATVEVDAADPLVMYDLSPAEFRLQGLCPAWTGFGLIPLSAGTVPPADCVIVDGGVSNPDGVAEPNPREVLIGRQFFDLFSYSSDCACASASKQHLVGPAASVAGTMSGILVPALDASSQATYQVFEPLSKAGFPVQ